MTIIRGRKGAVPADACNADRDLDRSPASPEVEPTMILTATTPHRNQPRAGYRCRCTHPLAVHDHIGCWAYQPPTLAGLTWFCDCAGIINP